jgi:hypothetical protein
MGKVLDIMNLIDKNGDVDICRALNLLKCDETELAQSLSLDEHEHSQTTLRDVIKSGDLYQHLLQIICIVNFLHDMGATRREAFLWFVSEKIPAVGGVTAKECIQNNHFEYLMDYLQSVKLGGYA